MNVFVVTKLKIDSRKERTEQYIKHFFPLTELNDSMKENKQILTQTHAESLNKMFLEDGRH